MTHPKTKGPPKKKFKNPPIIFLTVSCSNSVI